MKPSKEFSTRFARAKKYREAIRPTIEEIFRFCCPGRQYDFNVKDFHQRPPESDTFDSLPERLASDLGSDIVSYFTPREARWAEYAVISEVDEADEKAIRAIVDAREGDLFDLISASNYNDIAPQWGFETATHGTPALWVVESPFSDTLYFESVPPNELYVGPGFMNYHDRFRQRRIPAEDLVAAISMPGIALDLSDDKIRVKLNPEKKDQAFDVIWGFWLNWSDPRNPQWVMEITVDGIAVTPENTILGGIFGACPLHIGRFNPQPNRPWGRGAGWSALPDMRTHDTISEVVISKMDDTLKDTIFYADDGQIDMSEGLERGRSYPMDRSFTRDQVFEFQNDSSLDYGFFSKESFEEALRSAFYQDGPRQRGETPPTATQWADERRRIHQRIGKPSAPLWTEMIIPVIQRAEYLAINMGKIPEALTHNKRDIIVTPISPLQKAQNQDKVMIARSNLDLAFSVFQDQTGNFIDPVKTFGNIVSATGDELTVLREEERVPEE